MQDMGATVRTYDPAGMEQAKTVLTNVGYCSGAYECAEGADALIIVTEWEQFCWCAPPRRDLPCWKH
jgi:UDPglucose 6-dehydrogenase